MKNLRTITAIATILGAGVAGCKEHKEPQTQTKNPPAATVTINLNPGSTSLSGGGIDKSVFKIIQTDDVDNKEVGNALLTIRRVRQRLLIDRMGSETGEEGFFVSDDGIYFGIACGIGDTENEAVSRAIDEAEAYVRDNIPRILEITSFYEDAVETQTVDTGSVACVRSKATVMKKEGQPSSSKMF